MPKGAKVTFEVPSDLRALMDAHPEVNWSAVFREAIRRQAEVMEVARHIQDEMRDPRVRAFAAALREGTAKRYQDAVAARGRHARRR
jgi:ketopantoate reductase